MLDTPFGRTLKILLPPNDKVKLLNWLAIALGLWFLWYPYPYKITYTIIITLPFWGVVLKRADGLGFESLLEHIKIYKNKSNVSLSNFLFMPAMTLTIRTIYDFDLESVYKFLLVGTVGFIFTLIIIFVLLGFIGKSNEDRFWVYVIVIFNIAIFSYAGTYAINCVFDNSDPIVYSSRVLEKFTSGTKGKIYSLTVTPWGNHKKKVDVSVTSAQFNVTKVGDTIKLAYKKGLLGIPWRNVE
jgi:hypothetical protein